MARRTQGTGGGHENYGRGVVVLEGLDPDPEDVKESLVRAFASPAYVPPVLPKVGVELLALAELPM